MPLTRSQQTEIERMFDEGIAKSLETDGAAARVPQTLIDGLRTYAVDRRPTGDFLRACLEDSFVRACGKADIHSAACLPSIAVIIANYLPTIAQGDAETVNAWLALGPSFVEDGDWLALGHPSEPKGRCHCRGTLYEVGGKLGCIECDDSVRALLAGGK